MANKSYLDYAGLKRVLKRFLPGIRKIWHGTIDEWEALPLAEKEKYDQAEITEPNYTKEAFTDSVTAGDHRPLTSGGFASFLNRIGSACYVGDTIPQNHTGWKHNQQYTFNNVAPGTYMLQIVATGVGDGTGPFFVAASCNNVTVCHSSLTDIFGQCGVASTYITVNTTQNVSLTYSYYNNGGVPGRCNIRMYLIRIR